MTSYLKYFPGSILPCCSHENYKLWDKDFCLENKLCLYHLFSQDLVIIIFSVLSWKMLFSITKVFGQICQHLELWIEKWKVPVIVLVDWIPSFHCNMMSTFTKFSSFCIHSRLHILKYNNVLTLQTISKLSNSKNNKTKNDKFRSCMRVVEHLLSKQTRWGYLVTIHEILFLGVLIYGISL